MTRQFPLLDRPEACPVCGHDRLWPLAVTPNKKLEIARVDTLTTVGCLTCGMLWAHPLPTDQELAEYYERDTGWNQRYEHRDEAEMQQRLERKLARCEAEYQLFRPRLEGVELARRPKVLDFGAGSGEWMDVLAGHDWETTGIEPGESLRAEAAAKHRMLDDVPTEETYDLVIANRVFEHLQRPLDTMRELAAATKTGGYLFVTVPDFTKLPENRKFRYATGGVHIMSYTPVGLRSLLELAGFRVVDDFPGEEWDRIDEITARGLRVLARKEGEPRLDPPADPLAPAVESLRRYAEAEAAAPRTKDKPVQAPPTPAERLSAAVRRVRGRG